MMRKKTIGSFKTSQWMRAGALLLLLALLVGCAAWREQLMLTLTPQPTVVEARPTATPTPAPTPTLSPPSGRLTLRIWTLDELTPVEGDFLQRQVEAFSAAHHWNVQVDLSLKKAQGAGSAYDLLRAAVPVAPSILPDLVILSQHDLLDAANQGLIQPLSPLVAEDFEYFPVALQALRAEGETWGFPYLGSLEHMVYRKGLTTTAPISWTAVISGGYQLLFPAGGAEDLASDTLVAMYLGAGGKIPEDGMSATLDRASLVALYSFFADLVASGQLDPQQALSLPDAWACWDLYQQGKGSLSPVPAGSFWPAAPADSLPTWVPTPSGEPVALLHVWGIAMVTSDPQRQQAAFELVRWLIAAQHMADMAQALGMVPLRRPALAPWGVDDAGQAFLQGLFSHSVLAFPPAVDVNVRRALQAGLVALLQQDVASPEAAASHALVNLRR